MDKNQLVNVRNLNDHQLPAVKNMDDRQLLVSTDKLVSEERRITLEVLQHLREIEVRRLFVDLGFDSMYKYCLHRLKYSEGEAQRRLSAARLLRELPEIETQIKNGDLNMTNLSAVQSFARIEKMADKPLTREEKLELIANVENKSTRQVKAELIQHSHQPALLADKFQMSAMTVLGIQLTKFEASMTDENLELLQEFRNLYAHDLPDLSDHSALMFLLQKAVCHKKKKLGLISGTSEPIHKSQDLNNKGSEIPAKPLRKKSSAALPSAANADEIENEIKAGDAALIKDANSVEDNVEVSNPNEVKVGANANDSKNIKSKNRRTTISPKTLKQVWQQANACCEHVNSKTKTRCSSQFALEVDHINPVAINGSNELNNLRLLCRVHNSRRAIKTFGPWL